MPLPVKSQTSNKLLALYVFNNSYSAIDILQTPFPVGPVRGFNTVAAAEAVTTYAINDAVGAYDAVTANDAVYNDPDPKGYILNILLLVL